MFARTKRLVLRPGWREDAPALAAAIGHQDVLRNLARAPMPYRLEDAQEFLASPHHPMIPALLAFARTGGAPRLIGGCGIHRSENGGHELGYWIARPYWGLGFATEATQAVMSIARATGLKRVQAVHMLDNPASAKVLRKLGFRPTGRVETRYSRSRQALVPCALFEDDGETLMPEDKADELYKDRVPVAA